MLEVKSIRIIFSSSLKEYKITWACRVELCKTLGEAGFEIPKEKCMFWQDSVDFLGYKISKYGMASLAMLRCIDSRINNKLLDLRKLRDNKFDKLRNLLTEMVEVLLDATFRILKFSRTRNPTLRREILAMSDSLASGEDFFGKQV